MAQSVVVRGRDPDGNSADLNLDESGNLKIAGTFSSEPPVGGATEAKQTTQIAQVGEVQASPTQYTVLDRLKTLATLLAAGLPAALTAGGGVKTGLVDALPAGTAAIGKLTALPGLDIPAHDYISLSYTGSDLTGVVYKTGGSGGTTVATLTLGYTNSVLTSVTKS